MILLGDNFQHLLLTRFNIGVTSDFWIEHRLRLFENYCYPSVLNQTNQDFIWIVFLDSNTPTRLVDEFCKFDRLIPVFISDERDVSFLLTSEHDRLPFVVKEQIEKYIDTTKDFLITTRIDNDDLIRNDFIQKIQNSFYYQDFQFFDFGFGLNFEIDTGKFYWYYTKSSPFLSLFERNENVKTVFCVPHTYNFTKGRIFQNCDDFMWVQIVHGDNYYQKKLPNHIAKLKGIDSSSEIVQNFGVEFDSRDDLKYPKRILL